MYPVFHIASDEPPEQPIDDRVSDDNGLATNLPQEDDDDGDDETVDLHVIPRISSLEDGLSSKFQRGSLMTVTKATVDDDLTMGRKFSV